MNFSTTRPVASGFANDPTPTAQVMPFALANGRRTRREAAASTEPCGQILLFTGVRYERMPEAPARPGPALPRRRRS